MARKSIIRSLMSAKKSEQSTSSPHNPIETPTIEVNDTPIAPPEFQIVGGVLKKYNGSDENVVISKDLGIKSIGQRAFFKCSTIKTLKLSSTITSISNYAFSNCENLEQITIPANVTSIGNYAFENCKSLKSISLPNELNSVGNYLFSNCKSLTRVGLPENLRTISNYMFFKCESLEEINIPEKVAGIGWKAFSGCSSLKTINFSKRLNTIGNYAFESCSSITSIQLPDNLTNIGEGIFFLCENLEKIDIIPTNNSVVLENGILYNKDKTILYVFPSKLKTTGVFDIPKSVHTISYGAFSNCTELTQINIPPSVSTIENYAFFNCINLNNIDLPINVTSLGKNVFNKCTNLKNIKLPATLTKIESGTFSGCEAIENINLPSTITNIGEFAFYGCIKLNDITFSSSINTIGRAAFSYCNSLTEIFISKGITSIDKGAFSHCDNLNSLTIDEANPVYSSENGIMYSKDKSHLFIYPAGKYEKEYTIPKTVTRVLDQAFFGCNNLEKLILTSNLSNIGFSAFSDCIKLKEVIIEDGISSIGTYAFSKCISLEKIEIPDSVTYIDSSAFSECPDVVIYCSSTSFTSKFARENNIKVLTSSSTSDYTDNSTIKIGFEADKTITPSENDDTLNYSSSSNTIDYSNIEFRNIEFSDPDFSNPNFGKEPLLVPENNEDNLNEANYEDNFNNTYNEETTGSTSNETVYNNANNHIDNNISDNENIPNSDNNNQTTEPIEKTINKSTLSSRLKLNRAHLKMIPNVAKAKFKNSFNKDVQNTYDDDYNNNYYNNTTIDGYYNNESDTYYMDSDSNGYFDDNGFFHPYTSNNESDNITTVDTTTTYSNNNDNESINNSETISFNKKVESDTLEINFKNSNTKSASILNEKLFNDRIKDTTYAGTIRSINNLTSTPNTANSMFLLWDEFPSATEYHLLKLNPNTNEFEDISRLRSCKALITGLIPGITEEYKILAYENKNNEKVPCAASKPIKLSINLPPLTGFKCDSVTQNTITLSWNECRDALRYVIYAYKQSEKKFLPIEESSKTSITLTGLRGGTTLRLVVVAVKSINRVECETSFSNEVLATTEMPPVTGIIMASHTSTTVKLNWISINGVSEYKIYVYNPSTDNYELLCSTKDNFIVFENLTPNCEYYFRIRACKITNGKEVLGPPSSIVMADTYV